MYVYVYIYIYIYRRKYALKKILFSILRLHQRLGLGLGV
jgi:hypothetical protein